MTETDRTQTNADGTSTDPLHRHRRAVRGLRLRAESYRASYEEELARQLEKREPVPSQRLQDRHAQWYQAYANYLEQHNALEAKEKQLAEQQS